MNTLTKLHDELKSHTIDELWENSIKKVQLVILNFFEENPMKETKTNIVVYRFMPEKWLEESDKETKENELADKISNAIEDSLIRSYDFMHGVNKQRFLNDGIFNKRLIEKLVSRNSNEYKDLSVKVIFETIYDQYYGHIYTIQFVFTPTLNLDDSLIESKSKIINYLINQKEITESVRLEKEKKQMKKKKYSSDEEFNIIYSLVQEQYRESKLYGLEDIYSIGNPEHLSGLIKLINKADKYPIIYDYKYIPINVKSDFTESQLLKLNEIFGFNYKKLHFCIDRSHVCLTFNNEESLLPVSHEVMSECLTFQEKYNSGIVDTIISTVEEYKDKIIAKFANYMKMDKLIKIKSDKPFSIDAMFDPEEDTVKVLKLMNTNTDFVKQYNLQERINQILDLEGFRVYMEPTEPIDSEDYCYSVDSNYNEYNRLTIEHSIHIELPSTFLEDNEKAKK